MARQRYQGSTTNFLQPPLPHTGSARMKLWQMGPAAGYLGGMRGRGIRRTIGRAWVKVGSYHSGLPPLNPHLSNQVHRTQSNNQFASNQRWHSHNDAKMHQMPPSAPDSRIIVGIVGAIGSPLQRQNRSKPHTLLTDPPLH